MKKIFALVLAVVTLALCLTGCVHEELGIKLNKDGTGSIAATVALKKDAYEQLAAFGGDPFEGKETFEVEYDDEKYIAYTETKEYASFEEIEKALAELTYDTDLFGDVDADEDEYDVEIEDDIFEDDVVILDPVTEVEPTEDADTHIFKYVEITKDGSKYVFHAVLNPLAGDLDGTDMSDIYKVGISVEMPAEVTAYKNGTVDGKKVTFDLSDMGKEIELYAECKTTSAVAAIVGITLTLGAVALAIFAVLKKRK